MVDSRTALHRLMVETTTAELHDDMYVDEKTSSSSSALSLLCVIAALSFAQNHYHVPPTFGHTHARDHVKCKPISACAGELQIATVGKKEQCRR